MADCNAKHINNISGKYFVDTSCIGCGQCVDIAPQFFKQGEDGTMFVFVQPDSQEDIDACEQALTSCPVEAIGKSN